MQRNNWVVNIQRNKEIESLTNEELIAKYIQLYGTRMNNPSDPSDEEIKILLEIEMRNVKEEKVGNNTIETKVNQILKDGHQSNYEAWVAMNNLNRILLDKKRKQQLEQQLEQQKKLYFDMVKNAGKQTTRLLKKYAKAKKVLDQEQGHIHQVPDVSIVEKRMESGNLDGSYPGLDELLLNQMKAVSRTVASLKKNNGDDETATNYYKRKLEETKKSLNEERTINGKTTTDLQTIEKDLSPVTRVFKNIFRAVISIINPGYAIDQIKHSRKTRGHPEFWKSKGYDLAKTAKETDKYLVESKNSHFKRKK